MELSVCDSIIIGIHLDEPEFLIPIGKTITGNQHFHFKPIFKINNAIRVRHYGPLNRIDTSIKKSFGYISENALVASTDPYVRVWDYTREVYDIFVGISENLL